MIHFDKNNSCYILIGIGFNLHAFTLLDLRKQAKEIYNLDLLTLLN